MVIRMFYKNEEFASMRPRKKDFVSVREESGRAIMWQWEIYMAEFNQATVGDDQYVVDLLIMRFVYCGTTEW